MWYIQNPGYIVSYFMTYFSQQFRGFSGWLFLMMVAVISWLEFIICYLGARRGNTSFPIKRYIVAVLIIVYACFMFQVAIYRREPGAEHRVRTDIDFGSLKGDFVAEMQVGYCILNVLFFLPLGSLLALRRKLIDSNESFLKTLFLCTLLSFIGSSCIELTQLATGTGIFEITDIIANTCGGYAGAGLVCVVWIIVERFLRSKNG